MNNELDFDKLKKHIFNVLKLNFESDKLLNDTNVYTNISYDNFKTIKGLLTLGIINSMGLVELKYKLFSDIESWINFYKFPYFKNLDDFTFYMFNKKCKITLSVDNTQEKFTIKIS